MSDPRVGMCGLFCGNCRKFTAGKCAGCAEQPGFEKCPVRSCVIEKGYVTCADCDEMEVCKIRDNFINKVFEFIFGTRKTESLIMIRDVGMDAFIEFKTSQGKM